MTSIKENGLLYGLAAGAGVIGLVIIIFVEKTFKVGDLAALGMALSNTFGLSVGILLMGYGLVELPRETWKSDPQQLLKWCAHRYRGGCMWVGGHHKDFKKRAERSIHIEMQLNRVLLLRASASVLWGGRWPVGSRG
jgi:hypothetical protein